MSELKNHVKEIFLINEKCRINFEITKYFNNPKTEEEFNFIKKSTFFRHVSGSMWRLCVIDLYKLYSFSKNDKLSLRNLFNKLKNKQYLNHGINPQRIVIWEKLLLEKGSSIEKVRILRNKLYAHTEVNFKVQEFELYFAEVEGLMNVIDVIIKEIYEQSFNSSLDLSHHFSKYNGEQVIRDLVGYRKIKRMELRQSLKK